MTQDALLRSAPHRSRGRQSGVTLIELLISITLGLVVVTALVVIYTSGSTATRNAQAQAQMNEDAQMALDVISQELRRAGYNPIRSGGAVNDLGQAGWNLFACDTGFADTTLANVSALTCKASGSDAALAVVYEGDPASGKWSKKALVTDPTLLQDCLGTGVAATAGTPNYYKMQARLYVANNALNCRGSGDLTQTQVLAENIESMSLSFAVTDPAVLVSQTVMGYLTATEINTPIASLNAWTSLQRWNKVAAARVCVVVVSENPVLQDVKTAATNPTYQDCSGNDVSITDGKMRRAYRTTVLLRNHGVGYADS
ncbi:MAG: PilW family protein [Rhodoferax sp.]